MDAETRAVESSVVAEATLLKIIDASPCAVFVWQLTEGWPVSFVSNGISRFGYTAEEFLDQTIKYESIVHPDDINRVEKEVDKALSDRAPMLEQRYRIITRDGDTCWIKDWTEFLYDSEGTALQASGIILDISDFVGAEERARDYARFPLEDPNPVLRVDCFGDILLTNKAAQKMIEDLSEATPEQREAWKHMLALAADMQVAGRFDLMVGSRIFEFNINHAEGRDYSNLYGDDVTEKRKNQIRMIDIANTLPGALLQFTKNTDGTDEIVFLNKQCEEIWGIGAAEIEKDTSLIWSMIHPDDIALLRASVLKSAWRSATWRHEWRIVMPSGEQKWLRGTANPHSQHGGASVWNVLVFDITTEKSAAKALSSALTQAVRVLSAALEARDPYTAGHEQRVAEISLQIGRKMGLDPERLTGLELAATVHDVGKIQIPAEILSKPTRLSPEELALIKVHPDVGARLLSGIEFDWPIADIIRQHHERFDGTGYPDGLTGNDILLEARIIAVADTLEAMASHRPYRPGLGIEKAADEIRDGAGTRYDPEVASTCLELIRDGEINL